MKALIPITLASLVIAASSTTAIAGQPPSPEVTTGRFRTLPGGAELGYEVKGGAIMFRTDHGGGHTSVVVRIRGLEPETTYPTHVHDEPCSSSPPGGSHYQHVPGGPVDPVNEIWPTITTDGRGRGLATAHHDARARADAMAVVVHLPENTSIRLACVDLR